MNNTRSIHKRAFLLLSTAPLLLAFICLLFGVLFFFMAGGDGTLISGYFEFYMPLVLTINHLILFFMLRSFLKKDQLSFKDMGWYMDKNNLPVEIFIGLALAAGLYAYNELIIEPIQQISRGNQPHFSIGFSIREHINIAFLLIAVTLPVIEELIYRAYAYKAFKNKYGLVPSIIISSILFGVLHWGLGWLTALLIIPFGIVYFLVFHFRKQNIIAVVIGHCLYNALELIFI